MLTVEKIGGTSMSQFDDVLKNIIGEPGTERFRFGRVFVVSAYGGVTNKLLEDKKTKAPGIYQIFVKGEDCEAALDELLEDLLKINEKFVAIGLDYDVAKNFLEERISLIKSYLHSMHEIISSGYVERESIFSSARELLASLGEAHSAFNSVNILLNGGYQLD